MARTLADMSQEERQACVGLWCDNLASTAQEPALVVLACVQGGLCWILHTDLYGEWSCFSQDRLVPRPDLPRAWNPDGTPVRPPMSDNAPMTPDQAAAELASGFPTRTPEYILERAIRAMTTLAAMAEDVEYRINGGRYEVRRHVRYVTEWRVGE